MKNDLISVKEIVKILKCSKSKSYQVIAKLNKELSNLGYVTIKGKVSRKYFLERFNI